MEENEGSDLEVAMDFEKLLSWEKQMRQDGDVEGMCYAIEDILGRCFRAGAWNRLNEQIMLLFKRDRELSEVAQAVVFQHAMKYIDQAPDDETKTDLIKTLDSAVIDGKKYVEVRRALLIKKLAKIKEEQGLIAEAAKLMLQVQVETIHDMEKTQKIDFMLEQVRLCLDCNNYVQAQRFSVKITPKVFESYTYEEGINYKSWKFADDILKLMKLERTFHQLMIRYHSHSNDYLEMCRHYTALRGIQTKHEEGSDPDEWIPVLRKICWYLVLSPHGLTQSCLLKSTLDDKNLSANPHFKLLLKPFVTTEIIQWNVFWDTLKDEFENENNIIPDLPLGMPDNCSLTEKQAEDLKLRVIEHNIRVVSKCYSRISLTRLADLLALTVQESEKHLCDMVVSKSVVAKIDRPLGVVCFQTAKDANEILDSWAYNLEKLLNLVDKSCDKIHKEMMVHEAAFPH